MKSLIDKSTVIPWCHDVMSLVTRQQSNWPIPWAVGGFAVFDTLWGIAHHTDSNDCSRNLVWARLKVLTALGMKNVFKAAESATNARLGMGNRVVGKDFYWCSAIQRQGHVFRLMVTPVTSPSLQRNLGLTYLPFTALSEVWVGIMRAWTGGRWGRGWARARARAGHTSIFWRMRLPWHRAREVVATWFAGFGLRVWVRPLVDLEPDIALQFGDEFLDHLRLVSGEIVLLKWVGFDVKQQHGSVRVTRRTLTGNTNYFILFLLYHRYRFMDSTICQPDVDINNVI